MNDLSHDIVVIALAHHLGVDPLAVEGTQRLEEDWGLDALDLTLLAFRLEDGLEIEIAKEALEGLRTVADLQRLVAQAPASAEELDLGAPATASLREEVRRAPRRTRRNWVHRQTRRTLRAHAA